MTTILSAIALFLIVNLLATLWRVARGPTAADRMLAALLFGSTGVALLALLARLQNDASLIDAALVLALLAAVGGLAFAERAWREIRDDDRAA